jgi:Protein of unknown function DUF2625
MRPLDELVVADATAWSRILEATGAAPYPTEIAPTSTERGAAALLSVQVTTRSWLGAVAYHCGGLVIDHGWLRVYGAGDAPRDLPDLAAVQADSPGGLLVALDVLGGVFAWRQPSPDALPRICYFAPDSLDWLDVGEGYRHWLGAMLSGAVTEFYAGLRWPGWEAEVAACPLDRGIIAYPPLWTREGKDIGATTRRPVPMTELTYFHVSSARQLGKPPQ